MPGRKLFDKFRPNTTEWSRSSSALEFKVTCSRLRLKRYVKLLTIKPGQSLHVNTGGAKHF